MAGKILSCRCFNNLPLAVFRIFKQNTVELFKQFQVNNESFCLCHTDISDHFSTLLKNIEVQKYLNFMQTDSSYLQALKASQRDKILPLLETKKAIEVELTNLRNLSSEGNKDFEKLKEEEQNHYLKNLEKVNCEIINNAMPFDEKEENRGIEIQIIPAIGGDEAKLFAEELFVMYLNYIQYKNWSLSNFKGGNVDFKGGCISVSGKLVLNHFKHEAGVHRVQRVPETEKTGRTHTSTCSVVVWPQPYDNEIVIKDKDIIIEKMRSSAPGGQNVNKTESCVRIKHIPTGIMVENQTSRFQYENRKIAFEKLRKILFNREQDKINLEKKTLKKQQMGTNDYSDKIRTYHFIQNRVTDHRINYSVHNLKSFLAGGRELDEMIHRLNESSRKEQFLNHVTEVLKSVQYKNFTKSQISN